MKAIPGIHHPLQNRIKSHWYRILLTGIALLSFGLNFYAISQIGYGNAYYAAAIKSMMQSWHNFFYVSFDPAGMVSVDKPPLALWVQCLFVLVFGYHGWVMLLPQALAGAASSVMMDLLTAKYFGRPAGLLSALVFALTPAVVVASRNNTMDMQLILVLLIAAWFLFKSIETSKWRYLFFSGAMVGVGFNVKMLQAYMVIPAVVLVYLLCAVGRVWKRLLAGAVATVIMAAVSFAWVAAVDLTPASSRPYVGSSTNNTEMELIVGHNGMERVSRQGGGTGGGSFGGNRGGFRNPGAQNQPNGNSDGFSRGNRRAGGGQTAQNGGAPGGQNNRSDGMGFGDGMRTMGGTGNDIGTAGFLRLWQSSMYGQASWMILPVLFGILACFHRFSLKKMTLKQGVFLFWVSWLAVMAIFFSFASFFHRYYLCMLAPGIAGLMGIGFPRMYRAFRGREGWKQWIFPACVAVTDAVAACYVWSYAELRSCLLPLIVGFGLLALGLMAGFLARPKKETALRLAAVCALISMMSGPFYWSLTATLYVSPNITMPYAGPELKSGMDTLGMTANQHAFVSSDSNTVALEKYLVENYKEGSFLVMGQSSNEVDQIIADTGLPAVAYGGFLGTDQAMTLDQFKALVSEGKVTYFIVSDSGGMGSGSEIVSYVTANAEKVDASEYGGVSKIGEISFTLYRFGK
ncbi:ArnT family glycosyltransferase [Caproicibacter fermentans]|uniref:ArnT family glycosyltransferase n=1 Tax=Caproicibacter fermentans TaxID=2576756 RepID=UPI001412CF8F|nr:glycosyltransferase family 39 protein [Caproicibacter fermentans]